MSEALHLSVVAVSKTGVHGSSAEELSIYGNPKVNRILS